MEFISDQTPRGFKCIEFVDRSNQKCIIQKSSLAFEDAIWFGIMDPNPVVMASKAMGEGKIWVKYPIPEEVVISTRMHLTVDQVEELIPILQKFVDTGEI